MEDGLVMQLHTGLERNYLSPGKPQGKDSGGGVEDAPVDVDIPIAVDFSHGLRPLLTPTATTATSLWFCSPTTSPPTPGSSRRRGDTRAQRSLPAMVSREPGGHRSFLDSVVGLCGIHNLAGYVDNANRFSKFLPGTDLEKVVSDWVARLVLEGRVQEGRVRDGEAVGVHGRQDNLQLVKLI